MIRGSPLHIPLTVTIGHCDVFKIIMEQNEDKNPADKHGSTPLHVAAFSGHLDVCKVISEYVTDMNPFDNIGKVNT